MFWVLAMNSKEKISIIVCTYNRLNSLRRTLEAVLKSAYDNYEVLVVDDGGGNDIGILEKDFPGVAFFRQRHLGVALARNSGVAKAKSNLIAFIDDDYIPHQDWLQELLKVMKHTASDVVGGDSYFSDDGALQYSQYAVDKFGVVYFGRQTFKAANSFVSFNNLSQ